MYCCVKYSAYMLRLSLEEQTNPLLLPTTYNFNLFIYEVHRINLPATRFLHACKFKVIFETCSRHIQDIFETG